MKEGIPFVRVSPRITRNDDKTIDISFLIEPSEKNT